MRRPILLTVAVLTLVVASCGDGGSETTAATAPEGVTGTESPVDDRATEPWDLVWFSDSSGFDLARLWAQRIEQGLSVEVRVHDLSGPTEEGSAVFILGRIETESEVRDAIAGAEVIGLYANPSGTEVGDALSEVCGTTATDRRDPPEVYSVEDFEPYADVLRSIYEQVFELRAGQPTIVRAIDLYAPTLEAWRAAGIEPECTAGWEAMASTVREVAAEYGVPTAPMYDTFNGPKHDQDPIAKGFIVSDGMHPTDEGKAAQVEVLDALGYEPIGRLQLASPRRTASRWLSPLS